MEQMAVYTDTIHFSIIIIVIPQAIIDILLDNFRSQVIRKHFFHQLGLSCGGLNADTIRSNGLVLLP